jgi:hypothetical protein
MKTVKKHWYGAEKWITADQVNYIRTNIGIGLMACLQLGQWLV